MPHTGGRKEKRCVRLFTSKQRPLSLLHRGGQRLGWQLESDLPPHRRSGGGRRREGAAVRAGPPPPLSLPSVAGTAEGQQQQQPRRRAAGCVERQGEASHWRCRSSARATTRGDRRSRQEEEERSFRRFFAGQQRRSRRRSRPSRPPGSKPRPEQGRAVFRWRGRGGVARDGRRCKEQRRGTNTREVQEKKKKNVIDFLQRKKKRG